MEQSFADLLSDAFSESSVPSFPDGELDFENLNLDEKFDEDKENSEEDRALHQEAVCLSAALETSDKSEDEEEEICGAKSDEANFRGVQVSAMNVEETPQEDYASSGEESEQEESVSGDDEEVEDEGTGTGARLGDLLMSVHCRDELRDDPNEDTILAGGYALAPEVPENPHFRSQEKREIEEDEESYFGGIAGVKGNEIEERAQKKDEEEKQEDSPDSDECEAIKIDAETLLSQAESPPGLNKASLEFPEISAQNLQDLITEVDTEEHTEKLKDFSGEEHQEAGESFADYPSDFSSCEYVSDERKDNKCSPSYLDCTSESDLDAKEESVVTNWMGSGSDDDDDDDDDDNDDDEEGYLYSRDLEADAEVLMSLDSLSAEKWRENAEIVEHVKECYIERETRASDSYSSSDDEEQERMSDDEFTGNQCLHFTENDKQQEPQSWREDVFSSWLISDNLGRDLTAAELNMSLNLEESPNKSKTLPSDVIPAEGTSTNSYSEIQRDEAKTISSSSHHRSLDDGFFFTEPEALAVSEIGQLGDDEYEEERNWEQERIEAFNKFYNDSDGENEREERQIKVQFCTEPLSQVIHYETDMADRDSVLSSSDTEEEDLSSETSEEQKDIEDVTQTESIDEMPESNTKMEPEFRDDVHIKHVSARKQGHKCLRMLKVILQICVVVLMGLLMFCFIADHFDLLTSVSFFKA